jgi:alanyl-tRNA synthetase
VELLRDHDRRLMESAGFLRSRPDEVPSAIQRLIDERRKLEKRIKEEGSVRAGSTGPNVEELAAQVEEIAGAQVLTAAVEVPDAKALLDLMDRLKGQLKDAAILLGTAADGRVHLVASVAPVLVERGVKAGAVVKAAAEAVGGGGGGRDTMAQAGGRDPEKLPAAIEAARVAIESALKG